MKDRLDELTDVGLGGLSQMQVNHRGLETAVTEVFLDGAERGTGFQEMRGPVVAKEHQARGRQPPGAVAVQRPSNELPSGRT